MGDVLNRKHCSWSPTNQQKPPSSHGRTRTDPGAYGNTLSCTRSWCKLSFRAQRNAKVSITGDSPEVLPHSCLAIGCVGAKLLAIHQSIGSDANHTALVESMILVLQRELRAGKGVFAFEKWAIIYQICQSMSNRIQRTEFNFVYYAHKNVPGRLWMFTQITD